MAKEDYKINGTSIVDKMVVVNGSSKKGVTWTTLPDGTFFEGIQGTNAVGNISGYAILNDNTKKPGSAAVAGYSVFDSATNTTYKFIHENNSNPSITCYSNDEWGQFNFWNCRTSMSGCFILYLNKNNELCYRTCSKHPNDLFLDPFNLAISTDEQVLDNYLWESTPSIYAFCLCGGGGGGGKGEFFNRGGSGAGGGAGGLCFGYLICYNNQSPTKKYETLGEIKTAMLQAEKGSSDDIDIWLIDLGSGGSGGTSESTDGEEGETSYIFSYDLNKKIAFAYGGGGGEGGGKNSSSKAVGGKGGTGKIIVNSAGGGIQFKMEGTLSGASGGEGALSSGNNARSPAGDVQPILNYPQNGYSINKFGGFPSTIYDDDLKGSSRAPGGKPAYPEINYGDGQGGSGGNGGITSTPNGSPGSRGCFCISSCFN